MKEADTQGEKQLIVCPSILIWNLEDTSCWPSVESDVKNGREWLFCLFLAYRKGPGFLGDQYPLLRSRSPWQYFSPRGV